jgi:aspartate 1-decarboxylase
MFRSLQPSPAWRPLAAFLLCAGLVLLMSMLTACGGGVGEDGTGAPVKATSVGVVTGISADSVTVNDQTYALPASVEVSDAMVGPLSASDIQPGMWVQVQGEADAQGGSAVASRIQLIPSARGEVTNVEAGEATLTVLDTTIRLDANTLVSGASAQALRVGDTVEVHGLLDSSQAQITATRVAVVAGSQAVAELRGKVTALDAAQRTMQVGGRLVSYAQATVALGRALSEGMVVRVSSAQAPASGQIWVLDRVLPSQDLDPEVNAAFVYLEGYVDDFAAGPVFRIDGLAVVASGANGRTAITQNGQRVAVIGALRNGVLLAKTVSIVNPGLATRFTLFGDISAFVSVADFQVRGVQIDASQASFTVGNAGILADGVRVRVDGTVQGRSIVATKMKILSP